MADRLAVGLIGHGRWGSKLRATLQTLPGVSLGALCDTVFAGRDHVEGDAGGTGVDLGGAPIFSSAQQMLEAVGAGSLSLDAVVIATPSATHAPLALQALEHGLHVFVEKPLALQVAQAEALLRVAHAQRRVLMVGHILHHDAAVSLAYGLLHAGAIGVLSCVLAERSNLIRSNPNQPDARSHDASTAWWELAPHDVAVCSRVFAAEPEWVEVLGTQATIDGSAVTARVGYPNAVAWVQVGYGKQRVRRMAWVGSEGALILDATAAGTHLSQARLLPQPEVLAAQRDGLREMSQLWSALQRDVIGRTPVEIPSADALRGELSHFVYCVQTGQQPISDGAEGLSVVRTLAAGERAIDEHRRIHLAAGRARRLVSDAAATADGTLEPDA
jgi:UDP-2-acetamido-3-amino-2,3-dideoxy-glucuronate N-acetyltransferase